MGNFRESILFSVLKSFFRTIAVMVGLFVSLFFVFFLLSLGSSPESTKKTKMVLAGEEEEDSIHFSKSGPVILKINIRGVIGSKKLNAQGVSDQLFWSRRGKLRGNRVKGILLNVSSPGGSSVDSYGIYSLLSRYKEKYKVPVYVYVEGMSASGAVMISCAADKVFCSPIGIVGSVGVRTGPLFNFSKLMEEVGISQKTLIRGKNKDEFNPFRPWKKDEGEIWDNVYDYAYQLFVDLVVKSRPIDRDKLINVYGANIFNGVKAKELGYVDEVGSYRETLEDLAEKAGIGKQPYQVVELRLQSSLSDFMEESFSRFFGNFLRKAFSNSFLGRDLGELDSHLLNQPLYLYPNSEHFIEEGRAEVGR